MSDTIIDTLQLEIQTNSTNAAKGIDDLSAALAKLKKNTSLTVAVRNLNNLSAALRGFTSAGSAASTVGSLANSLQSLKNVGSVTRVANGITKLKGALAGFKAAKLEGLDTKLKSIADAAAPLASIKAGSLGTIVNSLSKLDKVVDNLDDKKIEAFAKKVERLSNVLLPLSQKMTTIQAGLRGINTAARSAGSGVQNMGSNLNTASVNMSSFMYISQNVLGILTRIAQSMANYIGQAIEWDGISARFGRGFGESAKETYEWIQRLNKEMGINVQQFMQYSSIYATMLTGFGVTAKDAGKMALGYAELTYDIWAGYNDVYKSYADAADAVKSAIGGEVEPIRRAGFTIVESQLEITAANHGLKVSLEKATEAQKSYLRYLTLVDQAYSQNLVGTYAKELNTAEGLMRTFSQQLKSLTQAFGSLFLPVLVRVMPYVQAFVELLTEAVYWVASLFGIEIQGVDWSDYGEGIGGVTDSANDAADAVGGATSALKELKNATLGIDELNIISPPSPGGSGGSGSGGGAGSGWGDLDVDSLWDESIFNSIESKVDEIKNKFKEWMPVIEGIGGALAALSLLKFIENIGEAMTQMSQLRKILSSALTVVIEAALVFMFADNYLETGNILYLLGEALATAGAGYLLFKAWGDKGAVLGMAVSVVAQLAAIMLNVADGTVDIGDPELWVQTAMTALTGAAGGYFAFRGVQSIGGVKGAMLGMTATLSMSLAAITIGDIANTGSVDTSSILTGLGSVLTAAGFGFKLGGPHGAIISAAVALAVNVVGSIVAAIDKSTQESMEADLEKRFGDIELSVSEIRVVIDKLMPVWAEDVSLAVDLRDEVEELAESIDRQITTIEGYEWQISVGIGLTEDEESDYRSAIEGFITSAQRYVNERGYALDVGLRATTDDLTIIGSANDISVAASKELEELGKQLQDKLNEAYADGILDMDDAETLQAIQNIRNDMMAIQDALAQGNIEAEFGVLEMRWSGVDLTPESFDTMMGEWKTTLDEKVKPALESTVKENLKSLEGNVAFAKIQLAKDPGSEEAQEALRQAEAALQRYMDENPLENLTIDASFEAVNFALNTLRDAYKEEIDQAKKEGWFDYTLRLDEVLTLEPGFKFDEGDGDVYGNIEALADRISGLMESELSSLPSEMRDSLEEMIEALKPTMADYEEVAAANRKAGETVLESVREGLNDYNELAALSGDQDAINYMIGKGFSTDRTFLNTLSTVEGAGEQITGKMREGLLNNLTFVRDDATGVVTEIKSAIDGKTVEITPELIENMKQMGVDLSAGLQEGVSGEEPTLLEKIKGWGTGILDKIREVFDTHSPSKETMKIGKDLSDGLSLGMSLTSIRTKLSDMWSTAKKWWTDSKGTLSTYTPSIGSIRDKLSSAWSTAKSWWDRSKSALATYTPSIGSIRDKVSSAWSTAKTWWTKSKGTLSYTPTIGSIKTNLSSAWSTAKTWWSKSKGTMSYTPAIGSIKNALSSAWTTAKNWWNKNVKLSIPSLSFKVTYDTPTGAIKKAVVKALGLSGWPKLSFAAGGGIFDQGSMIWAGERGPEIVANAAGGKTGVMNVQQMSDAVYEGVYAAVTAAMRANDRSSGQAVNVYLDGKQITSVVEQRQRERGTPILGNQVYSY